MTLTKTKKNHFFLNEIYTKKNALFYSKITKTQKNH